ncbi:hypothetical protein BDV93DRAFT_86070 [Ceratobasidium sp. AG-I]|nr:hypothetical protein BDV93DRAFT_86070 [Ceratobasidium sp. AG-I]
MKFTSPANIALASLALSSPSLLASPSGVFANAAPTPDASLLSPNPNSGYFGGSPQLQSSESPLLQGSGTFGTPPTAKIAGRRRSLKRNGSVKSRAEGSPERNTNGSGLGLGLGFGIFGFSREPDSDSWMRARAEPSLGGASVALPTNTLALAPDGIPTSIVASVIQSIPTSMPKPKLVASSPVPSLVVPEIRLPSPELPAHADVQPHGSNTQGGSAGSTNADANPVDLLVPKPVLDRLPVAVPVIGAPPGLPLPAVSVPGQVIGGAPLPLPVPVPNPAQLIQPLGTPLNRATNLLSTTQPSLANGPIQSLEGEIDGLLSGLPLPLPLPKLSDLPLPKLDLPLALPNVLPQLPPAASLVGGLLPVRRALGEGMPIGTDPLSVGGGGVDGTDLPGVGTLAPPNSPLMGLPVPVVGAVPSGVVPSGMPALPTSGLPVGTVPTPLPIPSASVPKLPIPGQIYAQSLGGLGLPLDGLSGLPGLPIDNLPIPSVLPIAVPALPLDALPIPSAALPSLPIPLPTNALPVSLPLPNANGLPTTVPIVPQGMHVESLAGFPLDGVSGLIPGGLSGLIPGQVSGLIPGNIPALPVPLPALPLDGLPIPSLPLPSLPIPLPTGVLTGVPLVSAPLPSLPIVSGSGVGDVAGTVGGVTGAVGGVTGAVGGIPGMASGVTGAVGGVIGATPILPTLPISDVPSLPIVGAAPGILGDGLVAAPVSLVQDGVASIKSATVDSPVVPLPGSAQPSGEQTTKAAPKDDDDSEGSEADEEEMGAATVNGSGMGAMGRPGVGVQAVQSGEKDQKDGEGNIGKTSNAPPTITSSTPPHATRSSSTDIAPQKTGATEPMTSAQVAGMSDPERTSTNYVASTAARTETHTEKSSKAPDATPSVMGKKRMVKVRVAGTDLPSSSTLTESASMAGPTPTGASKFISLVKSVITPRTMESRQVASAGSSGTATRRILRWEGKGAQ